jgi:hypothetical protein
MMTTRGIEGEAVNVVVIWVRCFVDLIRTGPIKVYVGVFVKTILAGILYNTVIE